MSLNEIEPLKSQPREIDRPLSAQVLWTAVTGERTQFVVVDLGSESLCMAEHEARALHTWLGRALAKPEAEHGFPLLP